MTYFLYDTDGYVGDLASTGGLAQLRSHAATLRNKAIDGLFDDGQSEKTEELLTALKSANVPASAEAAATWSNLVGLAVKAKDVLIITDGVFDFDNDSDKSLTERALSDLEKTVAFSEMEGKLDKAEADLSSAVGQVQERQVAKLVQMAIEDIRAGDMQRLAAVDVPYRDDMTKAIEATLLELYDYGKGQVAAEAKRQGAGQTIKAAETPLKAKALLRMRAQAMASVLAAKLKASLAWEALNQMQGGMPDRSVLLTTLLSLSDRDLKAAAGLSASEAMNLGRQAQASEMRDQVVEVTSSAVLDKNTCPYCRGLDGKTWTPGNEPAEPPYADCEGRDRCRCIFVYRFKSEVQ